MMKMMPRSEIDHFFERKISKKGMTSELKGVWDDPRQQKKQQVKHLLWKLVHLFPQTFDSSLIEESRHFFVFSPPIFWELRDCKSVIRLIVSIFLLKRKLRRHILSAPEKRHLFFRLFPIQLKNIFSKKLVWGSLVGVSIHNKFELFDEEHVLLSIQKWLPDAYLVHGSSLLFRNPQDPQCCLLYLELDNRENNWLSLQTRQLLNKVFKDELKDRVQTLVPLLFSVRNEEQVMKNILALSREIESADSIPHMILSFEKQTDKDLIFTAILVYADNHEIDKNLLSLGSVEVAEERKEIIGYLPDGFSKKALVLHLKIKKTIDILREDCSVNLLLARQKIYHAITNALGEIRDYDGGLLLKQEEMFMQLKLRFTQQVIENKDLLESFFYGITPIEKQATIALDELAALFSLALQLLQAKITEKGSYLIKTQSTEGGCITFLRAEHPSFLNYLHKHTAPFARELITTTFRSVETLCVGYILHSFCHEECVRFLESLSRACTEWSAQRKNHQVLRIGLANYPVTLDPRVGGDLHSESVVRLLFEGLMSYGKDGCPECAVAESVEISSDRKTYLFYLRECQWSDGHQISAHDFVYAWKKMLSPTFRTPFSHHLYVIKNARAAKEGNISPEAIGAHALNDRTFRIELEYPIPYFLELLTLPAFFPVFAECDVSNPHWAASEGNAFVCNGPFCLKEHQNNINFILERNIRYRDVASIHLDKIIFSQTDAYEALELFKNNELDWIGLPFQPWSDLFEQQNMPKAEPISFLSRVFWCTLNVQQFPLSNLKLRQSLALALNKKEIASLDSDNYLPAFSPLPPHHALFSSYETGEEESMLAQHLFEEGLQELGLTRQSFPALILIYSEHPTRKKIAEILSRQWKSILDLNVECHGYPWPSLFQKVTAGDYQIGCVGWSPLINNPLYTFEAFKWPHEPINFPKWVHITYQNLVNQAARTTDLQLQTQFLIQAELLLIKEVPVIPLFHYRIKAFKKRYVHGVLRNHSFDFRKAYMNYLSQQK